MFARIMTIQTCLERKEKNDKQKSLPYKRNDWTEFQDETSTD